MSYIFNKIVSNTKYFNNIRPAGIYLLKVNNRNNRARCEICSKLTIETPERRPFALMRVSVDIGNKWIQTSASFID